MEADKIKLIFSYLLATIVVVGGGLFLFLTRLDPPESASQDYGLLVAGFVGAAITFVFNQESATRAARSTERAIEQGGALGLTMPSPAPEPLYAMAGDVFEDPYDPEGDEPENEDPAAVANVPPADRAPNG